MGNPGDEAGVAAQILEREVLPQRLRETMPFAKRALRARPPGKRVPEATIDGHASSPSANANSRWRCSTGMPWPRPTCSAPTTSPATAASTSIATTS
jgi:hypothetical protein